MLKQRFLKTFIRDKFPFTTVWYSRVLKALKHLSAFFPLKIRLGIGMQLTPWDKRKIIREVYSQKEEMPLFSGKKVLLWEPAPWTIHIALIACIGVPLSLRGCNVELVICDGSPVACIGRAITDKETLPEWPKRCPGCYEACREEATSFGLKTQNMGGLVSPDTLSKLREISQTIDPASISSFNYKEVDAGSHALSSVIRYYQGKINEFEESILREYLFSTLVTTEAAINKIDSFKPDVIHMSHGMYSLWGPALNIALKRGIPVIKYGGAYRKQCMYYQKIQNNITNFHSGVLSDHEWETRVSMPLLSREEEGVIEYLEERYASNSGRFKHLGFVPKSKSKQALFNRLNLTDDKPAWCIFTHLTWDASVNSTKMAYRDYSEWVIETVKVIKDIPDVQWLIKIHPAEKIFSTVDGVEKLLGLEFTNLPSHIQVIPPDADINTYDIMNIVTGGITCHGTVGLELAVIGKPVIVAADAYYGQKGFTYDGLDADEYKNLLRRAAEIPPSLTPDQREKAIKFAYSYYIQRQLPLRMFEIGVDGSWLYFDWDKIESLIPGHDPVLDLICNRFFDGDDFIMDEDTIELYSALLKPGNNKQPQS